MNTGSNLEQLGWNDFFAGEYESLRTDGTIPARVISQERDIWLVATKDGELLASVTGKFRTESELFPVVGDWVILTPLTGEPRGVVQAVLLRKTAIIRQSSGGRQRFSGGKTREQVLAANINVIFIVGGLDGGRNVNLRRIERYLALVWNSGASPVILLNKADLCPDVERYMYDVESVAPGVPVHAVSARNNTGLEPVREALSRSVTGVFIGQSGAGKSALVNTLLGYERQQTGTIRGSDHEGRHTTTRRELIVLPSGGLVIDTPGIRELQLWSGEDGLDAAFTDIEELSQQCRFQDCAHEGEPGCAVKAALERGELDYDRLENYRKLQKELRYQEARQAGSVRLEEKLRWKKIAKIQKSMKRNQH